MPRVLWGHHLARPNVQMELVPAAGGRPLTRTLLADTGAGSLTASFELLLDDADCRLCGGIQVGTVTLRRAYTGPRRLYRLRVRVPALGFDEQLQAVGITPRSELPSGFDGNACILFLNRFRYGNFEDPQAFGLEY